MASVSRRLWVTFCLPHIVYTTDSAPSRRASFLSTYVASRFSRFRRTPKNTAEALDGPLRSVSEPALASVAEDPRRTASSFLLGQHFESEDNLCAICLEPLQTLNPSNSIMLLPCDHKFHKECLRPLLRRLPRQRYQRRLDCPLCRETHAVSLFRFLGDVACGGFLTEEGRWGVYAGSLSLSEIQKNYMNSRNLPDSFKCSCFGCEGGRNNEACFAFCDLTKFFASCIPSRTYTTVE